MSYRLAAPAGLDWQTLIEATDKDPAVRVGFAPIGPLARTAANEAVGEVMRKAPADLREEVVASLEDGKVARALSAGAAQLLKLVGRASAKAMIREGIREWEGIGDPDGEVAAVTPQSIEWFLADERLFAAADALYVMPEALRDAEKNVSAGSPPGTGTKATPELNTASSPAKPDGSAAAGTTKRKSRSAPTS